MLRSVVVATALLFSASAAAQENQCASLCSLEVSVDVAATFSEGELGYGTDLAISADTSVFSPLTPYVQLTWAFSEEFELEPAVLTAMSVPVLERGVSSLAFDVGLTWLHERDYIPALLTQVVGVVELSENTSVFTNIGVELVSIDEPFVSLGIAYKLK